MDFATLGVKISGNEAARRGEGAKRERESGMPKKSFEYILVRAILNLILQGDWDSILAI